MQVQVHAGVPRNANMFAYAPECRMEPALIVLDEQPPGNRNTGVRGTGAVAHKTLTSTFQNAESAYPPRDAQRLTGHTR